MVTIRDVAKLAGVSTATVSRVSSGDGAPVRSSTRLRVLHAIDRLGYVPNASPRFLRTQRSGKLLVVIPSLADPLSSRMLQAIATAAAREGYGTLLEITGSDDRRQRAHASALRSREAEGLICIGDGLPISIEGPLNSGRLAQTPAVTVGETNANPGLCAVLVDSAVAAGDAVQELARRGHTDIAIVGGVKDDARYQRQIEHVRRRREQLKPSVRLLFVPRYSPPRAGLDEGREIFGGSRVPSAVLCLSDSIAPAVMRAAVRYQLRVPDDVSIVALDEAGVGPDLQLSTMTPPFESIGEASVRLLLDRMKQVPKTARSIKVRYDFVARCSTESCVSRRRA